MFKLACFDGHKHSAEFLQEIISTKDGYDTETIVRWCSCCGAIVVDTEVDNRLMGQVVPMKFPTVVKLRENK
jgi:hypothetical protein